MFFHMVYKSGQIFLLFCHNSCVCRTDGRTDRILIARPRRGKSSQSVVFKIVFRLGIHQLFRMCTYKKLRVLSRRLLGGNAP